MKRSSQVAAPLLAAAALAMLTGCRTPQMQRCVDEHNNVVPDSFCKDQKDQPNQQSNTTPHPIYRYYYGGWGSYTPGTQVGGGSYTPVAGASYSTTVRGGFGSSFGGGEGEGGGHGSSGGE